MAAVTVVEGVQRDLAALPEDLRESSLAAVALAMAERIDAGRGSPSECGKALLDAMSRLRDLVPPKKEGSRLDELTARREKRLRGAGAEA